MVRYSMKSALNIISPSCKQQERHLFGNGPNFGRIGQTVLFGYMG